MATTSIWDVKGNIKDVLDYAENEEKTSAQKNHYSEDEVQSLRDVMNYAVNDYKTEEQLYVSGINCLPETARDEMQAVKYQYNKTGGIIAFHAYQSFAPGEITPAEAHQVGIEFAQKIWGDRFQVVVATHLDKEHLHNHFVVNSVSYIDGLRYYDNKANYARIRRESDNLCREHNLSVIENPKSRGKHYSEWLAEKNKAPTYRGLIREDIDRSIECSSSFDSFLFNMTKLGYTVKRDNRNGEYKSITLLPEGGKRGIKLTERSLGYGYSEEHIKQRLASKAKTKDNRNIGIRRNNPYSKARSLRGLYFYYAYEFKAIKDNSKQYRYGQASFPMREELMRLKQFSRENEIINNNNIETFDELEAFSQSLKDKVTLMYEELRETKENGNDTTAVRSDIKKLNYDIRICEQIKQHSIKMQQVKDEIEKSEEKEKENEE